MHVYVFWSVCAYTRRYTHKTCHKPALMREKSERERTASKTCHKPVLIAQNLDTRKHLH